MNSEVVPNTVTCAVAVVQAYLPQSPATQHLHVCTYTEKYASNSQQHKGVQMTQRGERMLQMVTFGGDSGFRASCWMLVSHLWSPKEIWFEIFQCFPGGLWWRPPVGPDMQNQANVEAESSADAGDLYNQTKTLSEQQLYILIQYKTQIFTLCISVGVPQWTVRVMSVVPSLSVVKDNMTHFKHNQQEVKLQRRSALLLTGTDRQSPPGTSHQPSAYGSTHSSGWNAEKQEIQQPFSKCRCRDTRKTLKMSF